MAVVRTNLATNPSHENGAGAAETTSLPANSLTYPSDGGAYGDRYARRTFTATGSTIGGGLRVNSDPVIGSARTVSVYLRPSVDQTFQTVIHMINSGVTLWGNTFEAPAGVWTRVWQTGTPGPGTTQVRFEVLAVAGGTGSHIWQSGETLDEDGILVEDSDQLRDYFDGDTTDTGLFNYAWTGAANGSTSTISTVDSPLRTIPEPYGRAKATNSRANLTVTYRSGWLG